MILTRSKLWLLAAVALLVGLCLPEQGQSFTYQWRTNGVPIADGLYWIGTATPSLIVTNVDTNYNGRALSVVVANDCGSVTSIVATLTVTNGASSPPLSSTIFSDDFNRVGLGESWTIYNGATIGIGVGDNANMMECDGSGTLTEFASWTSSPMQGENWNMTWIQHAASISSTTYGTYVGMRATDPTDGVTVRSYAAAVGYSTGSVGDLFISDSSFNAIKSSVALSPIPEASDVLLCSFSYNVSTLTFYVTNTTQGGSLTLSTNCLDFGATYLRPEIGYPTVWAIGGYVMIDNLAVRNTATTANSDLLIGDSIGDGYASTDATNRFFGIMQKASAGTIYNCSASSDMTAQVLMVMPQLLSYQPAKVYLMIGGNDIYHGVATDTWKTNYLNIVSNFTGRGISVYHLLPTPRTANDLTALTNFIISTYPSSYIDTWTPLVAPDGHSLTNTCDIGDGVHPNDLGHLRVGQAITNAYGKFP